MVSVTPLMVLSMDVNVPPLSILMNEEDEEMVTYDEYSMLTVLRKTDPVLSTEKMYSLERGVDPSEVTESVSEVRETRPVEI